MAAMLTSPLFTSTELDAHRGALLRYAQLQLRNKAWAEDAVSDTLLSALEKPKQFEGRSQLRTWLIGILKHKVMDILRRNQREVSLTKDTEEETDFEDALFQPDGHFREMPQDWGNPQAALGQRQFLAILEDCVEKLPAQTGRVFLMREWLELETEEICKELAITPTHLWVILHRARMRLRECLELNGYASSARQTS
jgi:RNA polymerase sigma-70 factor (ECF subfamily)